MAPDIERGATGEWKNMNETCRKMLSKLEDQLDELHRTTCAAVVALDWVAVRKCGSEGIAATRSISDVTAYFACLESATPRDALRFLQERAHEICQLPITHTNASPAPAVWGNLMELFTYHMETNLEPSK